MRLKIDTSEVVFRVAALPAPKTEFKTGEHQRDRDGRPLWQVQLYAKDTTGGEMVTVTVAGEQPKLTDDQHVTVEDLIAIPYVGGKQRDSARLAFRATAIRPAASAQKAA